MLFENKEKPAIITNEHHWHERVLFTGLFLIIAVMPLIVRGTMMEITTPMISIYDSLNSGTVGELFTYYKYIFILIVTALLFILFLYRLFILNNSLVKDSAQYMMLIFAVLLALSALYSNYSWVAISGVFNRHDGSLVHLASIVLFLVAANLSYSSTRLHALAYGLAAVIVINTVIGTYYFYGGDILQFGFVQQLILPASISADQLGEGASLRATLNNPNYVSGLAGMSALFFMFLAIFHKTPVHQRLFFVIALSTFALLFTSTSQSGSLTLFTGMAILGLLLAFNKTTRKKTYAIRFTGLIASFFILLFVYDHQNERVWSETVGLFGIDHPFREQVEEPITGEANLFGILRGMFTGEEDEPVEVTEERVIELPEFPEERSALLSAGSGRLYIWSRTVPLIAEKPIFGHGMDTILYTFPQHEPEKLLGLSRMGTMLDKPHNIYFGLAYGAGIPALLAFLGGIAIVLGKGTRLLLKQPNTDMIPWLFLGASLMFTLGYLIQGIGNDPIIGTLPIFWILAGVGVALMNENKETPNR